MGKAGEKHGKKRISQDEEIQLHYYRAYQSQPTTDTTQREFISYRREKTASL